MVQIGRSEWVALFALITRSQIPLVLAGGKNSTTTAVLGLFELMQARLLQLIEGETSRPFWNERSESWLR